MNCVEVGDLMQRKLDLDLSDQEAQQLEAHLEVCKSCQIIFQRLSMLSSQLEQLPQVTPSFSIVDSILPKLAEIDKQKEQLSRIHTKEDAVTTDLSEQTKQIPFIKKRWVTVVTSGLVAAAAIVFVVNINTIKQHNNSDTAMTMTAESLADTDTTDQAQRNSLKVGNGVQEMKDTDTVDALVGEFTSTSVLPSPHIDQLKTEYNKEEATKEVVVVPTSQVKVEVPNQQLGTDIEVMEQLPPEDSFIENEEFGIAALPTAEPESFNVMGIAEATDTQYSPNGQYYLKILEHTIVIHDSLTGEAINTIEVPILGFISFVGWHENSLEFYIDVIDEKMQTHNLSFSVEM
jgi:hypothetical protein